MMKKAKGALKRRLNFFLLLIILFFGSYLQCQEELHLYSRSQADKDWKELVNAKNDWSTVGTLEELQAYGSPQSSNLHNRRLTDKFLQKNSRLAEAFWDNYPKDKRRDSVLYFFFDAYFEPTFISKRISDSIVDILAKIPKKESKKYLRMLPIDTVAMEQWRKKGDDMVKSILVSNASIDDKEVADFLLICREYREAARWYSILPKKDSEIKFWEYFDRQYWEHIKLCLEKHVNKYAALEIVAKRIQNILNLLKDYSAITANYYWTYFLETTGSNNLISSQPGIKALHLLAAENVSAIEALSAAGFSENPLEMKFTAMDGTKVDLADMRGKIVLIDFWATYCGPCVKEMPHVRQMYDKYKDHGFEVIGIAADGDLNKGRVLEIIKKANANWAQRLDKGPKVSVSFHALYKIGSLPTVWLLNKEGIIVDRNARGKRLEPLIRKHLGLNN